MNDTNERFMATFCDADPGLTHVYPWIPCDSKREAREVAVALLQDFRESVPVVAIRRDALREREEVSRG